jgi:hypothetical protein
MRGDDVREFFESVDAEPSSQFSVALLARLQGEYLRADLDTTGDVQRPTLDSEVPVIDCVDEQRPQRCGRGGLEQPSGRPRRRRIAVAVAAAAAVALIVGAAVIVRTVIDDKADVIVPAGPSPTTYSPPTSGPPLPDGLTGLPPQGAPPSTPATGQLLATLPIPIWVYEDGRVISARWTTHNDWTGYLEQRLSPSGVELVRAEILALKPVQDCKPGLGNYGYLDGSRTVCESPGYPNLWAYDLQYQRLSKLQYGARSWLPASAWVDPQPKPYVPARYHLEIDHASAVPAPVDAATFLATVSPEVAGLLTHPSQCPFGAASALATCFEVTTDEARDVATALEISAPQGRFRTSDDQEYVMAILPYLPHGTAVWCCGG